MNGLNGKYTPSSIINTKPFTDTYTIEENIGRGKYAVVKKCLHKETKDVVAAKFIRKRRKGKSAREEILREVVMLEMALAHPRLVDLLEVYETSSELILVTEYCEGGELFHECVIEESFKEEDVIRLVVQILEGLVYLHEQNIVHLDLKPQNILLTKPFPHGTIKICDLGFACLVNSGEDIRDIIGTADYVAPEVLDYEPLNMQTDMWSMGVLTYVMLTAFSPFAGDTQQETFCNISTMKVDFPPDLFGDKSPHCQDFIRRLLVKNAKKRLTARQCLEHPWLKSFVIQSNLPPTISDSCGTKMDESSMKSPENVLPELSSESSEDEEEEEKGAEIIGSKASVLLSAPEKCEENHVDMSSDVRVSETNKSVSETEEDGDMSSCGKLSDDTNSHGDDETQSKSVNASSENSENFVSVQNVQNRPSEETSVSKVTFSVNKTIVLKPLSSLASINSGKFANETFISTSEQTEITQFSKTFEKKTELSSPTTEIKSFPTAELSPDKHKNGELNNPFNCKDQKVMPRNRVQRSSFPFRGPGESIKNKDKDESFKRRSMEIPVKRRKSETIDEDEDIQRLASLNQRIINPVEELAGCESNSSQC